MKSIDPKVLSPVEIHHYLLSTIAPRPIALASTIDKNGNVNLSPFSFFNVFSSNPPTIIFSPARRGRDNTTKDTYENVKQIPEVVINVVDYSMIHQTSLSSCEYPSATNEFEKAGFSAISSEKVSPPRVGETPAAFECTVEQIIELGQEGGAGNLIIAKVIMMHFNEAILDQKGKPDTTKLELVGRMGADWYVKAFGNALFEIMKPSGIGIGIDALPKEIRESTVLTGNDLAKLGNLTTLPTQNEVITVLDSEEIKTNLMQAKGSAHSLHILAKTYLENNQPIIAYGILTSTKDH